MSRNEFDIHDDDLRVIGQKKHHQITKEHKSRKHWWYIAVAILICLAISLFFVFSNKEEGQDIGEPDVVFEPMTEVSENFDIELPLLPLGDYSDTTLTKAYTEHLRDTINDIPLDIYIPHNAVP